MKSPNDRRYEAAACLRYLLIAVFSLAVLAWPWADALAQISFTVLNPDRISAAGASDTFLGTITNNTDDALSSQELFFNFSGFDPAHLSVSQLLGNVNFTIDKGQTSGVVALFRTDLAADAKPGLYPMDMLLQDQDNDLSDPLSVTLRIVPEPTAYALLSIGLIVVLSITAARKARRNSSPRQRQSSSVTLTSG
jgi:hypothetical protein